MFLDGKFVLHDVMSDVRFACNARIVMSQDPADARMGGINDPTVQWRKPDLDQNSTLGV